MDTQRTAQVVLGLVLAVLVAAGAADTTTGLVGYWPLNGDGQDASGNELHGTVTNVTPVADRLGNPDSAMSFTGVAGSIITVGNLPKLQLTGEMTLAA